MCGEVTIRITLSGEHAVNLRALSYDRAANAMDTRTIQVNDKS